jgi:hypothetical protein
MHTYIYIHQVGQMITVLEKESADAAVTKEQCAKEEAIAKEEAGVYM